MAIETFAFDPVAGFKDATSFPDPVNETAARAQLQLLLDQIKMYVNEEIKDVLNSVTDGSSGGDNVSMTPIVAIGAQNTVQSVIEMLIVFLQSSYYDKTGSDDRFETITNLNSMRRLSAMGDFTGTLSGTAIDSIKTDIAQSLTLSQEIINLINNRESIGTIYDGGNFTDTDTELILDGGDF